MTLFETLANFDPWAILRAARTERLKQGADEALVILTACIRAYHGSRAGPQQRADLELALDSYLRIRDELRQHELEGIQ